MSSNKILFVVSEVEGLAKSGGLADVGRALPVALNKQSVDVRVVCPYYRQLRELQPDAPVVTTLRLALPGQHFECVVRQVALDGLTVYAIDYPAFFDRAGMYDDGYEAYADNGLRFSFFSLAALELAMKLKFKPDVVHCNDWQTGFLPAFLKQRFADTPFFAQTRTVMTIHNAAFQGLYPLAQMRTQAELPSSHTDALARGDGLLNLLQCGVLLADHIVAVSPTYAEELKTPLGAHGLFTSFLQREEALRGILNGCDYSSWDPSTDSLLPARFDAEDLAGKAQCKQALQQRMGLEVRSELPLFGMVCRITDQKGLTLLLPLIEQLMTEQMQLLVVGNGDPVLCRQLAILTTHWPGRFVFFDGFSEELAHLIYAGSDFFLMPSLYEPCGLAQMYALAYGTLPLVREVGGLRDTVVGYRRNPANATGFSFIDPSPDALKLCIQKAAWLWHSEPQTIDWLRKRAMSKRFTWERAAQEYLALYRELSSL